MPKQLRSLVMLGMGNQKSTKSKGQLLMACGVICQLLCWLFTWQP
jgi:hypothetical protein